MGAGDCGMCGEFICECTELCSDVNRKINIAIAAELEAQARRYRRQAKKQRLNIIHVAPDAFAATDPLRIHWTVHKLAASVQELEHQAGKLERRAKRLRSGK